MALKKYSKFIAALESKMKLRKVNELDVDDMLDLARLHKLKFKDGFGSRSVIVSSDVVVKVDSRCLYYGRQNKNEYDVRAKLRPFNVDGWKVKFPKLLYASKNKNVLVFERVHGSHPYRINEKIQDILDKIEDRTKIIDLCEFNIKVDPKTKTIFVLDLGITKGELARANK